MWKYEKRLQYPVNITRPNAEMAKVIISQFGGTDDKGGILTGFMISVLKMSIDENQ